MPPPSSAALASAPNCAKFADNIEGARSMTVAKAALLPSHTKLEYTRGLRDTLEKRPSTAVSGGFSRPEFNLCQTRKQFAARYCSGGLIRAGASRRAPTPEGPPD